MEVENILYSDVVNPGRYQSFVVFEPASVRISDTDILYQGDDVRRVYDDLIQKLISKEHTIKEKILHNSLSKIGNMLDLLNSYDNVIITRFFDRIWRRYSYISHLGEAFLNYETYVDYVPEAKNDASKFLALRYDKDLSLDDDSDDSMSSESSESSVDTESPKKE
jgi:acetyl/propionyl-CoA carboxylase alpha subunit